MNLWIGRQNAIQLEEKEKKEKEMLEQIIKEADEYKVEFYRKRSTAVENNKASNREKEKVMDQSQFLILCFILYKKFKGLPYFLPITFIS